MKKIILMAIFFCSFANGMKQPKPVIDWTKTQKVYNGLARSIQNKQQFSTDVVPGVCVLPLFRKLSFVEDANQKIANKNNILYCIVGGGRFSIPVRIEDSKDLVNCNRIQRNNECDIISFVNSFGTENIRCMIDNNNNTCESRMVGSSTLAMNFLHACKDNKPDLIRGILSYVNQKQAKVIVQEAKAILSPVGLGHLKQACTSDVLHFRGVKADTQSFLKLFNDGPQEPQQAKKTTDGDKTGAKIIAPAAASWRTKFMWLGGGLVGLATVAGIYYLFFVRNK